MSESKTKMQYRFLGNSGLKVSVLSFGSWVTFGKQVDIDLAADLMRIAFENGVNFFDNAEVYAGGEAEKVMGAALKKLGWDRSEYVVSTKIFWGGKGLNQRGLSRKHIVEGMNNSLERFQLDYVDLVFCHRPDLDTPIEETVRAMNHIIDQGKAFYWGTSEWSSEQIQEATQVANRLGLIPPLMEQPQYSMLHRERFEVEYKPIFDKYKLGTTIWSPLAGGLLTGKYNNGIPEGTRFEENSWGWGKYLKDEAFIQKLKDLAEIAKSVDASLAQLAVAWCVKNPNVSTVILGASKVWQLEENLKAMDVVPKMTDEIMEKIEAVLDNKPQPAKNWRDM